MPDTPCDPPDGAADTAVERPTVGDIFRQYGAAYRRRYAHRLTRHQRRVMGLRPSAMMRILRGFISSIN